MEIGLYVLIALVLLALVVVKKTIVIIPQSETRIIERLGRYYATLKPGINIIIPFIDQARPSWRCVEEVILIPAASTFVNRFMTSTARM